MMSSTMTHQLATWAPHLDTAGDAWSPRRGALVPHELHGCRVVQEGSARRHAPPGATRPVGYGVGCGPEGWVPAVAVGEGRELGQPPQLRCPLSHGHVLLLCSGGSGGGGCRLVRVELCLMLVGGLWLLMHMRLVVRKVRVLMLLRLLVGGGPRLSCRHRQGRRGCKHTSQLYMLL